MTSRTASDVLDASGRLPEGTTLVVHHFSWADYEQLLRDLSGLPHLRASYDHGKLEVMSPLPEHEEYISFIEDLVRVYADQFGVRLEKRGRTTWKRRALARGVEPDASYYVQSADRIIGKRRIDLDSDPPPDIVVEIDITNESLPKFPLYAALAVPEIWRYDGKAFQFYELAGEAYLEAAGSRFLQGLTGPLLTKSIDISKSRGQTEALKVFRERIRR